MNRMHMAWIAALTFALACGNGTSSSGPSTQGQSHWLESCEDDGQCGSLACICGVCIATCDSNGGCAVEGRTTTCRASDGAGARALCGEPAPASICLESCGDGCPTDQRCAGGACVPEETTAPSGDDAGGGGVGPADAGDADSGIDAGPDGAVDSGARDGSVEPDQDAAAQPLDCMAFPAFDRSCDDVSDCVVGTRQNSCCGSQAVTGLNAAALASFTAAAATCARQFPACGCAPFATVADDGSTAPPTGEVQPTLECIDRTCRTTYWRGPTACGPSLTCDAATEICVAYYPVGPSIRWSCEPIPAGCEQQRTCQCAGSTLCDQTFVQCVDVPGPNEIDCNCTGCQ